MVVFTCNNCGDSLQKPKVAKHYQFQCRQGENLTCVDCHKDFYGQEYVAHTKCITESERYGGANYVARPGQNKGARKQEDWINVVKNVIDTATDLSRDERNVLNILSNHENIPRKKAKFLNFIRSVMGHRINMPVIESVWARMETAFKEAVEASKAQSLPNRDQEKSSSPANDSSPTKPEDSSKAENENNENICRENGNSSTNGTENTENGKKKKSKKRDLADSTTELEDRTPVKKNKRNVDNSVDEASTNRENGKFDWKAAIVEIVASKDEISVKKLRKRVVNRYVDHCNDTVTPEKAASRFEKKLRKLTDVIVNDDKVRMA